ncbi:hypothetical protein ACS4RS_029380 (plasmid) [Rhizobium sp. F40D2]
MTENRKSLLNCASCFDPGIPSNHNGTRLEVGGLISEVQKQGSGRLEQDSADDPSTEFAIAGNATADERKIDVERSLGDLLVGPGAFGVEILDVE